MSQISQSRSEQLRSRASKLAVLADLLDDQEIVTELEGIFASAPPAPVATKSTPLASLAKRKKSPTKQRGSLERKALDIVKSSVTPLTAKDVTTKMETEGFRFSAENHQVAVSKALRELTKKKMLHAEQIGHAKSPVLYSYPMPKIPVQGMQLTQ